MGPLFSFSGEGNFDHRKLTQNPYYKPKKRLGREALFR